MCGIGLFDTGPGARAIPRSSPQRNTRETMIQAPVHVCSCFESDWRRDVFDARREICSILAPGPEPFKTRRGIWWILAPGPEPFRTRRGICSILAPGPEPFKTRREICPTQAPVQARPPALLISIYQHNERAYSTLACGNQLLGIV